MLVRMRDLCKEGMSPAEAAEVVKSSFARDEPVASEGVDDPFVAAQQRIVDAARRFDPDGIEHEIRHATLTGSAGVVLEQVLAPAMRTVGQMWHDGELSVGHEHLLSEAVTRFARDALHLVQPAPGAPLALLACFADEQHSLPLYLVAFTLAQWGYRTVVLGQRTPPSALADAVKVLRPDLVGLSVTVPLAPERSQELVEGYAGAVGSTPWLVGGSGVNGMRDLIERTGGVVASQDHETLRRELGQAASRLRKGKRRAG